MVSNAEKALWGVVALVTLVLTHEESGAPYSVWLVLVVLLALMAVLRRGRLGALVRGAAAFVAVILLALLIPFGVDQMREALYPQTRADAVADLDFAVQEASLAKPVARGRARAGRRRCACTAARI